MAQDPYQHVTQHGELAEVRQFYGAWTEKMVEIWRDRLELFEAIDTRSLYHSVQRASSHLDGFDADISFTFLYYGIYVDAGTGRGYTRGNGGDLKFLGKDYRKKHKLGEPRQRKRWFSTAWYVSREVLKSRLARMAGEHFVGALSSLDSPTAR